MKFGGSGRNGNGPINSLNPGVYRFEVETIRLRMRALNSAYSTGSEGWDLVLNIIDSDGSKKRSFDKIVNTDKAKWKFNQFAKSVGIDPASTDPDHDWDHKEFIGKSGMAHFEKNKDGYLQPDTYIDAAENQDKLPF